MTDTTRTLAPLDERFRRISGVYESDRSGVKAAISEESFRLSDVAAYLTDPAGMPYGRMLVYQDADVEVMLMNWDTKNECLPHDHGESEGWVQVLVGTGHHVHYASRGTTIEAVEEEAIEEGTVFFAPKGMVHHMANPTADRLITLHFYFPPIHAMEVFDLRNSQAAVVADDCGAWWPVSGDQVVERRSLRDEVEISENA